METDTLGRASRFDNEQRDPKPLTLQYTDSIIIEASHRLGPQTLATLYKLIQTHYTSYRSFRVRVLHLRKRTHASFRAPFLHAPRSQRQGAIYPNNNFLVVDVTETGRLFLQTRNRYHENYPRCPDGEEWAHGFMGASAAASIYLGSRDPSKWEFIYHDEIVDHLKTVVPKKIEFPVPPYSYTDDKGQERIRHDAIVRPDRFTGIRYLPSGDERIFLHEEDRGHEVFETDVLFRKSHKHSILSYYALLSRAAIREEFFGNARVGVLNTFSDPRVMSKVMQLQHKLIGDKSKFLLYQSWEAFHKHEFRPRPARPEFFTQPWHRVGHPPFYICDL